MDHWRRLEKDARNDRGIRSSGINWRFHRSRGGPNRNLRSCGRRTPHSGLLHPRTRVQGGREEHRGGPGSPDRNTPT
eukprot:7519202-Heterocapsa_arctica.AAC.1